MGAPDPHEDEGGLASRQASEPAGPSYPHHPPTHAFCSLPPPPMYGTAVPSHAAQLAIAAQARYGLYYQVSDSVPFMRACVRFCRQKKKRGDVSLSCSARSVTA
jgi:hypothetical protein